MPHKFTPEYPPEFRSEAVRLVRDGGRCISAAAMDLGVSAESLRHRVKRDALDSGQRKDGLTSDERKELVRLPRENRDLREDARSQKKPRPSSPGSKCAALTMHWEFEKVELGVRVRRTRQRFRPRILSAPAG